MNDPVVPVMPVTQVPPPPSYLRPPMRPSHNEKKLELMLWTGIAAIILSVWGFTLFGGFSGLSFGGPLEGSVVLVSPSPELGVYTYHFGATDPLVPWDDQRPPEEQITGASFSPNKSFFVETVHDNLSNSFSIFLVPPQGGGRTLVFSGGEKPLLANPIVANDGAHIVAVTSINTLLYAVRGENGFTVKPITQTGTPIAFSPDGGELLIANRTGLLLITLASGESRTVTGFDTLDFPRRPVIAVSSDETQLAVRGSAGVEWGNIDWSAGTFTRRALIGRDANALFFSFAGELVVLGGSTFTGYRLRGKGANPIGTLNFSTVMHPEILPISWMP